MGRRAGASWLRRRRASSGSRRRRAGAAAAGGAGGLTRQAAVRILGPFAVMATVCSKWAERLPSAVTTVHLSPSVLVTGLPMVIIGSIASVIPSRRSGAAIGAAVVGHLRLLVEAGADAVAHQFPHDAVPRPFGHLLYRVADVSHVVPRPCLRDPGHEAFLGHAHEPLRLRRDAAHADRRRRVGMQSLELHPDVHAHDASLAQHAPGGRDPVDDLHVDRGAEGLGKAVEPLERRRGARRDSG